MPHTGLVIQPGLLDGWSMVIEGAKSLQVPVIASELVVRRELRGDASVYFDPYNENEPSVALTFFNGKNGASS